jgi:recombination protein RecT
MARKPEISPEQHQGNLEAVFGAIQNSKTEFQILAKSCDVSLSFDLEARFAMDTFANKPFAAHVGARNPDAVTAAMKNLAAIGLSLNPIRKHAYFVPRNNQIVLDIPYGGLIELAIQSGSIKTAYAVEVFEKDLFEWKGFSAEPFHQFNPFAKDGERGEFIGVYCVAKLCDNELMVGSMSADDVHKARALSKAYQADPPGGPWIDFPGRMRLKTVIKREWSTWPKGQKGGDRMYKAIEVLNRHEGLTDEYLNRQNNPAQMDDNKSTNPDDYKGDYDDKLIQDTVKKRVDEVVRRAKQVNAWAAAFEYVIDQFSGNDRMYAISVIEREKPAKTSGQSKAVVNQ